MENSPKYSLNKRCSSCNKLIKKDTICNECYEKLEYITFNKTNIEPVYCARCNILIGFSDTINKLVKYCNSCFVKVTLGE